MEQNIPIEHINNPDAPFNEPMEPHIKYPRVIAEDIIDDDAFPDYYTNDDGDEFEI